MELKPDSLFARRLPLFPITTQQAGGALSIAGLDLEALAAEYGTPLYLYDHATLDDSVGQYRAALAEYYPGPSAITYAGKAFLCTAIAQWAVGQGLVVDCTGAVEQEVAAAAGAGRSNLLVHGVSKSQFDLQTALNRAGVIVVDNLDELNRLIALGGDQLRSQNGPQLWLRLRPGMAVDTHAYTQTGQDDSKFGLGAEEFLDAVQICQSAGLPLSGLHFHQGSHFHDPAPIAPAVQIALDLAVTARERLDWSPGTFCPGGGWGVPYHEDDLPHQPAADYVRFVAEQLVAGCRERGLPLPTLHLEPGRSLVARAGVALYRVQAVKHTSHRRWLLLDGGLADNPRPALYGARYAALPVHQPSRPAAGPAWLAGPFCESGDILISDLQMPAVEPGELVAVPVSGAYQLSMGSNYNGARKPAVLWLDPGRASLIQRRETLEDLLRRDLPLPGQPA